MRTAITALVLAALVVTANCNLRVKRIVGGEKAAIPKPLDFAPGVKAALTAQSAKPASPGTTTAKPAKTKISDTIVAIYEEEVTAKIEGVQEADGSVIFKGIRYAENPTGRNRFQRPIIHHPKDSVKAQSYGSPCLQPTPDGSGTVGSEDCLFLNIHTPSVYVKNATGAPVLFWIHGGGFTSGSGNQYGAAELVKKNVVVVTFNYRLGSLGFLGSRDQQMAGNSGLFDVRAAFDWIQRYIAYFGGSPKHIYVAGQGNGASMAMLLAQSDFTSGYLKGVIAMSGTGISSNAMDYKPGNTSSFIANSTKCSSLPALETLRCIQKSSVDSLFSVDKSLQNDRIGGGGFVNAVSKLLSAGPMVEGKNDGRFLPYFLHDVPLHALKANKTSKVPLLIGTAKSETGKSLTGKFKSDVLKRIETIPNFVNKALPKFLVENNVGVFVGQLANKLIDFLFNNELYLKLFSHVSKATSDMEKIVEATTDALFNLPASTTSQLWKTAGGESYFYSFEHETSKSPAKHFLEGLNMFSGAPVSTEKSSSHGDDLLYLFELQSLEGKPEPESALKDPKDLKVKNLFVDVVTEFVKTGKPKVAEMKENWPPFNPDHSYVVIAEKPRVEKKFRYCQVALWGGFMDILQNPFCNLPGIKDIANILPKDLLGASILNPADLPLPLEGVTGALKDNLKLPVKLPTDKLIKPLPIGGGLLGGDDKKKPSPPIGGGLLGGGDQKKPSPPIGGGLLGGGENKSGGNKNSGGLLPGGGLFGKGTESPKPKQSSTTTKKTSLVSDIFG